jgi:hypothetical protein
MVARRRYPIANFVPSIVETCCRRPNNTVALNFSCFQLIKRAKMRAYLFPQLWEQTDEFLVDFWPLLVAAQQTASSSRRQKEEAAEQAAAELVGATDPLEFSLSFPF